MQHIFTDKIILERKYTSYVLSDIKKFKTQLLNFGTRFSNFCFLENNEYNFNRSYESLAGIGDAHSQVFYSLTELSSYYLKNTDWIFGHVNYDYKNQVEDISSANFDGVLFQDVHFFIPEIVFIFRDNEVGIWVKGDRDALKIFDEINRLELMPKNFPSLQLTPRFSKEEYIETVKELKQHITHGDCYEICFCQEFYSSDTVVDPVKIYGNLNELSPNPFSAFYKLEDKFLACASPERFLKKTGNEIISQPIKGTVRRNLNDSSADDNQKENLFLNEKERAENIMIVDLVRNDLSKICSEATVKVNEFLGIHSFPQVHQMISTITGKLKDEITLEEIFKATFPMGSMTGAPKKRAMELIEKYERTKRGLFSGTIGYINPEGDFDFNVVIRSILYNEADKYVSIQAGSAITFLSDPEKEFEECEIKITAMKQALIL